MTLPALLTPPLAHDLDVQTWIPGDPLYVNPGHHTRNELLTLGRRREQPIRPMVWSAREAVPAPWGWLCGPRATGRCSR